MKRIKQLTLLAVIAMFFSCSKNVEETQKSILLPEVSNTNTFVDLILKASINNSIVESMHSEAVNSASKGLDESVYLEEILNTEDAQTKSEGSKSILKNYFVENYSQALTKTSEEETFSINDVEIYWPYCENWDGITQPVIVINTYDDSQFIEDDKVYAYKVVEKDNEYSLDTLIVDEIYSMENPVWVINKSDVSLEEIISIQNASHNNNTLDTKSPYLCETKVVTFKATEHHDVWVNGGSEFEIHWLFPSLNNEVLTNKSGLIKFTRGEINDGKTKTVNFLANLDWMVSQYCNRMIVLEVDESAAKEVSLSLPIKLADGTTISPSVTLKINKLDDSIMDYNIYRHAMFTVETQVDATHYQRYFSGGGTTLLVSIRSVETVPGI